MGGNHFGPKSQVSLLFSLESFPNRFPLTAPSSGAKLLKDDHNNISVLTATGSDDGFAVFEEDNNFKKLLKCKF